MPNPKKWYAPLVKALRAAAFFVAHALLAALIIGLISAVKWVLQYLGEPVLFDRLGEEGGAVSVHPRCEDEVMGALDGADRVNLDEPHSFDQLRHRARRGGRLCRRVVGEPLSVKKQPACVNRGNRLRLLFHGC